MAISTKTYYVRGQALTLQIESDSTIDFDVINSNLNYEVQEEDNPFNYTIGGVYTVNIISNVLFSNITNCTLFYGSEIWFKGIFKTDEERESLETYKYFRTIKFSDVLSDSQDRSFNKRYFEYANSINYPFQRKNIAFRFFDGELISQIATGFNENITLDSNVDSNGTILTLSNTQFDARSLFQQDLNTRDLLGQIAFTYGSRANAVADELKYVDVTKSVNLYNVINIDNYTPNSNVYKTQNLDKTIEYNIDSDLDNVIFNKEFVLGNADGSDIFGFYSFPDDDNLYQSSFNIDPSDKEVRYATDPYGCISNDGYPSGFFAQQQTFNINAEFDLTFDETRSFDLKVRLVYTDFNESTNNYNFWYLQSDGNWFYVGNTFPTTSPISNSNDTLPYTNIFNFDVNNTSFNKETGGRTLSYSFDIDSNQITGTPTPQNKGSYSLQFAMLLRDFSGGTAGMETVSFTNASLNVLRPFRATRRKFQYDTFSDVALRSYQREAGITEGKAYGDDIYTTNGIILLNGVVLNEVYLLDYINSYDKVDYIEIQIVTSEKITPISRIVYEGKNYFVQKMDYDLSNGICTLTIKECNE